MLPNGQFCVNCIILIINIDLIMAIAQFRTVSRFSPSNPWMRWCNNIVVYSFRFPEWLWRSKRAENVFLSIMAYCPKGKNTRSKCPKGRTRGKNVQKDRTRGQNVQKDRTRGKNVQKEKKHYCQIVRQSAHHHQHTNWKKQVLLFPPIWTISKCS